MRYPWINLINLFEKKNKYISSYFTLNQKRINIAEYYTPMAGAANEFVMLGYGYYVCEFWQIIVLTYSSKQARRATSKNHRY